MMLMSKKRKLPGINIQWPISEMIIKGEKIIETRKYAIPKKYVGQELALIETPGPKGKFKARIRAIIKFEDSFEYKTKKSFYEDSDRHCVTPDLVWKWLAGQKKFGWPVTIIKVYEKPLPAPKKKGIVFATECEVN